MLIKVLRYYFIFFNFLILLNSHAFSNNLKGASSDIENIKNMFSSETIGGLFVYPNLIKDYSLSGISIVEFNIGDDGKINEIEIIKSLGQPFDDAIFNGLDTFASQEIIQRKISKGFRYRLPIYFKN
ncbi:MAG: energy transducer TonB [Candidatus Neomarinimicrobiota bacterium]